MIYRGSSHAIRDDLEIMKRLRRPVTIQLLKQLQWFYEARSRRLLLEKEMNVPGLGTAELEEFRVLMDLLSKWMNPPLTLYFEVTKPGVDPVKAAKRKARRERKNQFKDFKL